MTRVINGASDESALFMTAIDIGTSTILVSWGSSTHTGNVRTLNEDAALVAPPVFVVADGMGGHDGGEIASALAIESMKSLRSAATIDRTAIVDTVAQAGVNEAWVQRSPVSSWRVHRTLPLCPC
jgi:hypothetical protein